ncbi:lysophospholipid acyltransferase family protein [Acidipropionibacterium timonense]|uniref:1-acyl-sn-glycerol-3-phosphate acyltransferase n=1 Tax=Acidipropionibacterium timonense TaxID=2161818 RepID=UPI001030E083|nr:1-acyl-sn-glycerol-3-phosphate acyltransferase [Acidipropionibacterium timonense]
MRVPRVEGLTGEPVVLAGEALPEGPFVLAVHHCRRTDALVVRSALRRAGRSIWLGLVLPTRAIPWGTSARAGALARLRSGVPVLCFPEGAPAPRGAIHKGDVELAHLALEGRVVVVPAYLDDESTQLVVGGALDFSRHADTPHSRAVLRAVTDEVMEALACLTGLPYRDTPVAAARSEQADARRERARSLRADRQAARQAEALERQEVRAQAAREAADLARAAVEAREAARQQALRAAMEDRRRSADRKPTADPDSPQ